LIQCGSGSFFDLVQNIYIILKVALTIYFSYSLCLSSEMILIASRFQKFPRLVEKWDIKNICYSSLML
jgi:hypothetical protein